jgi:RND family efflux transporter MFP subunit
MSITRKTACVSGFLACCLATGMGCGAWSGQGRGSAETRGSETSESSQDAGEKGIPVKTIRPKLNPHFVRSVTQPADLKPFYRAELMARVAGVVTEDLKKNIGDTLKKGEILMKLDVPDLVAEVDQREASVKLARKEEQAALEMVKIMEAAKKKAATEIKEKGADIERAEAKRKFKESELHRFQILVQRKAVTDDILDEKMRDLELAEADKRSGEFAKEAADAGFEEYSAKLSAARVDVEVKQARAVVAQADLAHSKAMLDYATIRAPFKGMIVERKVDPGSFVQNASTGHPTPLLCVVRTDVMTAVMYVPEKSTAYVNNNTEAVLRFDALGDREIHAKVTRASHWLEPDKSRDMRIEVDLENKDGLLDPGMYGTMTLVLQEFANAHLVPTSAVFERDGKTYIFEVKDGQAHLVPVRVELEDGIQTKIVKLVRHKDPKTGHTQEATEELTGAEEIIRSGQGEIADGQYVRANQVDW